MTWHLECEINGAPVSRDVPADCTLLSFLRDHLGLTGTKGACLEGECGSCTVLLDGEPVCSCLVLAAQVQGRQVRTVESLAEADRLAPVQAEFIETGAAQCGYCTPGLLVSSHALLQQDAHPSRMDLCTALEGNLCRCTGYASIIEAVERAAEETTK